MSKQNRLSNLILNSRLVYLDGKTIKDINTLKPEIEFDELTSFNIEDDYEIVFYDKQTGILKLEKYDKNKRVLYTLGGLSPDI